MTSQSTTPDEIESPIASRLATIQELVTDDQRAVVCVRGFRGKKIEFEARETKVAHTILAQKGKDMSNLGEDVIIWKEK